MRSWEERSSNDFHEEMYRESITKVVFKNDTTVPDGVTFWEISEAQNGSVVAYVEVTLK